MAFIVTIWSPEGPYRRAVASLDSARMTVKAAVLAAYGDRHDTEAAQHIGAAVTLPPTGGTVGPLPDGSTVEARPVTLDTLKWQAGLDGVYASETVILDAWNARNAGR